LGRKVFTETVLQVHTRKEALAAPRALWWVACFKFNGIWSGFEPEYQDGSVRREEKQQTT
jgi:hypothetical protein